MRSLSMKLWQMETISWCCHVHFFTSLVIWKGATRIITNCDRYYKVRWLLQIATVHLSSCGWQVGRQSGAQPFNHAKQLVMLRLSSSRPIGNNFPCHYFFFGVYLSSDYQFQVYYKVRQALLQSATEQTLAWKDLLCFVKTLWYWNI